MVTDEYDDDEAYPEPPLKVCARGGWTCIVLEMLMGLYVCSGAVGGRFPILTESIEPMNVSKPNHKRK